MKLGRSTGKPTVAQQQRMAAIREIGCIVAHSLVLIWATDRSRPRCIT